MFHRDITHTGYSSDVGPVTASVLWSKETGNTDERAYYSPVVTAGKLYTGSTAGTVYCFDAVTGEREWSFTPDAAACSTPAIADNRLYFGSCDDHMYCLDATTGKKIWSYQADSYEIRSSPAVAGGLVYFTDDNLDGESGKIYCLDAYSGLEVWSYSTGTMGGWSSPAVAHGIVFVGAGDKFFAFGEATQQGTSNMQLSLESSISYVGFKVAINGNLTNNEEGVSGAPILLSYSVTGGDSWNEITLVYTTDEGKFSAIWLPSATGCYLVKASWAGNSTFLESNTVVSLSVIGVEEEKVFSVTSNSTLTQLAFNSTERVLVFSVSGPSGTAGHTKISIAKTLIGNEEQLKVYLDGTQVNFTSQETEDAFQIIFTYYHSTHKVVVTLGSVPSSPPQLITLLSLVLLATGLAVINALSVWRIRKGKQRTS